MSEPDFSKHRPLWQTSWAFVILLLMFGAVGWFSGLLGPSASRAIGVSMVLALVLLALSWIDLERYILPDVLTLPLIVSGVMLAVVQDGPILESALGALVGYGLVAGLAYVWRRQFGRDGIGLGDAKLLAAGGAWVGVFGLPYILLISSGGALVLIVALAPLRKSTNFRSVMPFGPMLAFAIWSVWCFPQLIP